MARPPVFQAQDKLALLLALVPYLLEHDGVSVQSAATHFGVTEDQLRAAVLLIAVSGVPGESRQYLEGDLFDISWEDFEEHDRIVLTHLVAIDDSPRFSSREAAALIAGLQYLSALPENADRLAVASLTTKLARGASGTPSPVAVAAGDADASLALLRDAVARRRRVHFDYLNGRGDRELRAVDPLRAESVDRDWYLRGFDHGRGALRTFRLDRMSNLSIVDEPILSATGDLPDTLFQPSADDLTVTVEVAESALAILTDYLTDGAKPARIRKGWVRTSLRVAHLPALNRLVAGMPGVLVVLAPEAARTSVASWTAAGADRYDAAG